MKRNIIILATALGSAVILLCWLCLTDNKPAEPPKAPELPKVEDDDRRPSYMRTPEARERWDYTAALLDRLPYPTLYTIGMASKISDWVVVGTVEKTGYVADMRPGKPQKVNGKYFSVFWGDWIVLSVDLCLYGKRAGKKMTFIIPEDDWEAQPEIVEQRKPKLGDRMLVFLTDKQYDLNYLFWSTKPAANIRRLDFEKTKAERTKIGELYPWTYITLDDKTIEEEAVRAAKVYIDFFGGKGKRDRETYHDLLCSLAQSPVQRIRDDAERDIMRFYGREAREDIDKLLNDDRVRKEMKDYFRFSFRNEKPEGEE